MAASLLTSVNSFVMRTYSSIILNWTVQGSGPGGVWGSSASCSKILEGEDIIKPEFKSRGYLQDCLSPHFTIEKLRFSRLISDSPSRITSYSGERL